jgi:hypothetical protein
MLLTYQRLTVCDPACLLGARGGERRRPRARAPRFCADKAVVRVTTGVPRRVVTMGSWQATGRP